MVEIGIKSQENLKTVEVENTRKYEILAKELGQIYKCTVTNIPYVFTWEGLVKINHQKYKRLMKIEDHIEAYIQSVILKKTFESISIDYRRCLSSYNAKKKLLDEAKGKKV